MKIIAISGKVGSGKDVTANILTRLLTQRGHSVKTFAFADRLKQAVAFLSGEDIGVYYSRKGKEGNDSERRKLLVAIGIAANSVDPLLFVKGIYKDINHELTGKRKAVAIITDLRLTQEYYTLMDDKVNDIIVIRLVGSFKPCLNKTIIKATIECDLDFLNNHILHCNQTMFVDKKERLAVIKLLSTDVDGVERENNRIDNILTLVKILDTFNL